MMKPKNRKVIPVIAGIWKENINTHKLVKFANMIRKLKSGEYSGYSRKKDVHNNKRRNLKTFSTLAAAKKHEQEVEYFKRK